jgi:hypothetical protein
MARARNVKPGIFSNEILGAADPLYTLAFLGLWLLADREGRLEDRPLRIKGELFPYRDGLSINELLDWLQEQEFILRYEVAGRRYIEVINFTKHQNPHKNEKPSELPAPKGISPTPEKIGSTRADSHNLTPDSLQLIPEDAQCSPSASAVEPEGFGDFWQSYPRKVAKPQAIKAWKALKLNTSAVGALMAGLQRAKQSDQWQRDDGKFIPYPASYLNGRRWEDEQPGSIASDNPFAGAL